MNFLHKYFAVFIFLLLPFFAFTFYLLVSRWPIQWSTDITDYIAFGLSLLLGLLGLFFTSWRLGGKVIFAVVYLVVMYFPVIYFGVVFVLCEVLGDCSYN